VFVVAVVVVGPSGHMRFAILALRRRSGAVTRGEDGSSFDRVSMPKNNATIRCHHVGGAFCALLVSPFPAAEDVIGTKSPARAEVSERVDASSNAVLWKRGGKQVWCTTHYLM